MHQMLCVDYAFKILFYRQYQNAQKFSAWLLLNNLYLCNDLQQGLKNALALREASQCFLRKELFLVRILWDISAFLFFFFFLSSLVPFPVLLFHVFYYYDYYDYYYYYSKNTKVWAIIKALSVLLVTFNVQEKSMSMTFLLICYVPWKKGSQIQI